MYSDYSRVKIFKHLRYGQFTQARNNFEAGSNRDSFSDGEVSCLDASKHILKKIVMIPFSLIQTISLMQAPVVKNFIFAAILYMLLVFVDMVRGFHIIIVDFYYCFTLADLYSIAWSIKFDCNSANTFLPLLSIKRFNSSCPWTFVCYDV